jgi:hypothetical protein
LKSLCKSRDFWIGAVSSTAVIIVFLVGYRWAMSRTERSPENAAIYDTCLASNGGNENACDAHLRIYDRAKSKDAALEKALNEGGAKMLASGASKREVVDWATRMGGVGSQISNAAGMSLRDLQNGNY